MISNKHISKIIVALMAVAVTVCLLAIGFSSSLATILGGTAINMEYETELFDVSEIISINIIMDEDEWNEMLQNATSEEYYVCDVIVNGQRFYNVAIRPKGNTSLSSIAMDPETDRFSLKLEFDHFVEGQTCFGLDKLILNNNFADATNMKEAIVYDMYQFLDADASLYNYASVSLNGEYWGVYLALEGVEESFMLRNYGTQDGELYKPESMGVGGGNEGDSSEREAPGGGRPDMGDFDMSDIDRSDFGGFSMGGGGSDLNYTDDDLDSYSTIWEGEVTGTGSADHRRVVTALQHISEGDDIEEYLDVDNILKYMAVHTFAVNMDSLTGIMAHNYYLYEYDGQLNLIPWDYNLSFGGMSMDSATDMINDPIDTPYQGTDFFDCLLENEEYLEIYHGYLQQLVEEYVYGGRFDEVYTRIRSQIDSLVETDPTAFYSYDEYQEASDMLYDVIKLRAESIEGQLNGTIPSTDEGKREDASSLIDGSAYDLSVMGSFNMGFGGGSDDEATEEMPEMGGFSGPPDGMPGMSPSPN